MNECCTCNLKRNATLISSIGPGPSASWLCLAIHNWLWGGDPGQELLLKVQKPEGSVFLKGSGEHAGGKREVLLGGLTFGETEVGSPGFWAVGQRSRETNFLDPYLCLVSCVIAPSSSRWFSSFSSSAVYTILPPPPLPVSKEGLQCGDLSDL